jgi:hypothetical protein
MCFRSAQDDVMLELHVDDTHGEVPEGMLTELAFYVPSGNEDLSPRCREASRREATRRPRPRCEIWLRQR